MDKKGIKGQLDTLEKTNFPSDFAKSLAYKNLGLTLLAEDEKESLNLFIKAAKLDDIVKKDLAKDIFELAYRLNDFKTALEYAKEVPLNDDYQNLIKISSVLANSNFVTDLEYALKVIDIVIEAIDKFNEEIYFIKERILTKLKRYEELISFAKKCYDQGLEKSGYFYARSLILDASAKEETINYALFILDEENTLEGNILKADTLITHKRLEEAKSFLESLLENNPEPAYDVLLVRTHLELKDFTFVIDYSENLITKNDPIYKDLHYIRYQAFKLQKKYDLMIESFDAILKFDKKFILGYSEVLDLLFNFDERERLLEYIQIALTNNLNSIANYYLAKYYDVLENNPSKARHYYKECLKEDESLYKPVYLDFELRKNKNPQPFYDELRTYFKIENKKLIKGTELLLKTLYSGDYGISRDLAFIKLHLPNLIKRYNTPEMRTYKALILEESNLYRIDDENIENIYLNAYESALNEVEYESLAIPRYINYLLKNNPEEGAKRCLEAIKLPIKSDKVTYLYAHLALIKDDPLFNLDVALAMLENLHQKTYDYTRESLKALIYHKLNNTKKRDEALKNVKKATDYMSLLELQHYAKIKEKNLPFFPFIG